MTADAMTADGCVVLFAPIVSDAEALAGVVESTAHRALVCRTREDFEAALAERPLCAIVSEEGAGPETGRAIESILAEEPGWSTLPLIFAVRAPDNPPPACRVLMERRPAASLVILQRPVPPATLRGVLDAQVQLRQRQFETAGLLERLARDEQYQRFLLSELRHRTGNILGILQATVRLTAMQHDDIDSFSASLVTRLQAVAAANEHLASVEGDGKIALHDLLMRHTAGYRISDDQVILDGPEVLLEGSLSFDLALMVHEMATNAAKYGAFTRDAGQVCVSWEKTEEKLSLVWTERGGPPVTPPETQSFGTRMIQANARKHKGVSDLDFAPEGLVWRLEVALTPAAAARRDG